MMPTNMQLHYEHHIPTQNSLYEHFSMAKISLLRRLCSYKGKKLCHGIVYRTKMLGEK